VQLEATRPQQRPDLEVLLLDGRERPSGGSWAVDAAGPGSACGPKRQPRVTDRATHIGHPDVVADDRGDPTAGSRPRRVRRCPGERRRDREQPVAGAVGEDDGELVTGEAEHRTLGRRGRDVADGDLERGGRPREERVTRREPVAHADRTDATEVDQQQGRVRTDRAERPAQRRRTLETMREAAQRERGHTDLRRSDL
jgi:hypothetical protein